MVSLNTQENPVENARGLDERKYKGGGDKRKQGKVTVICSHQVGEVRLLSFLVLSYFCLATPGSPGPLHVRGALYQ